MIKRTELIKNLKKERISAVDFVDKILMLLNEHLTSHNINLFSKALKYKHNDHIENTWTFNGVIFVHKTVNKPPILITDEKQLEKAVLSKEENEEEGHSNNGGKIIVNKQRVRIGKPTLHQFQSSSLSLSSIPH